MTKPTVHYKGTPRFISMMDGGLRALVLTRDHPDTTRVSNTKEVLTSYLVGKPKEDGSFETENSIYQRKDPE